MELYIFPSPVETICDLEHDTAGWVVASHLGTHPSNGAPCQVFTLPGGVPNGHGATLIIPGPTGSVRYHGVLYLDLPTGVGMVIDIFPPVGVGGTVLPKLVVSGQFIGQDV